MAAPSASSVCDLAVAGAKKNLGDTKTRPTVEAFSPITPESLKSGALLGWFCIGVGILAVVTWIAGPHLLGSGSHQDESNKFGFLIFGPLAIPIGAYFFIANRVSRKKTDAFLSQKQSTVGEVTHLWTEPHSGDRSRCRIGYRFAEGPPAYQRVENSVYKSMNVGDQLSVEYLPHDPAVSRFVPPASSKKS